MAHTPVSQVLRRRERRRHPVRRFPDQLHILSFRLAPKGLHPHYSTVLVRGRMGQIAAIGPAFEKARLLGREPFCVEIRTVPPLRPTPALDALCSRLTAFPTLLVLLTAAAGYWPSIRLDLLGRDGLVLARAYDRQQARWGDSRRAFVSGQVPRRAPERA